MPSTPGFVDALGERFLEFDLDSGTSIERLHFKREFGGSPAFEAALRDQIERFEYFRHPAIAIARSANRLPSGVLVLESRHVPGRRLSEVGLTRNTALAVEVIRQLTPALVALHEAGDVVHGLVGPERVVITRESKLVLMEPVLGTAMSAMRFPATRLREEFGAALPASQEILTVDQADDLTELGLLVLSLLVGRRIQPSEYPDKIEQLVGESAMTAADLSPEAAWMRRWIERAVRVGPQPFKSAREAVSNIGEMSETGVFRREALLAAVAAPTPAHLPPVPHVAAPPAHMTPSHGLPTPHHATPVQGVPTAHHVTPAHGLPVSPVVTSATSGPVHQLTPARGIAMPSSVAPAPHATPSHGTSMTPAPVAPVAKPTTPAAAAPVPTPAPQIARPEPFARPEAAFKSESHAKPEPAARPDAPARPEPTGKLDAPALTVSLAPKPVTPSKSATHPPAPAQPAPMWAEFVETEPIAVSTSTSNAPSPVTSSPARTSTHTAEAARPAGKTAMPHKSASRGWLVPGLALLSLGEAAVIVGLLVMRPEPVATLQASTTPAPVTPTRSVVPPAPEPKPEPAPVSETKPATPAPATADATPAGDQFGGVRVTAPFDLQVFEAGKLLGVTAGPIALKAGPHALDFANDTLEFKSKATILVKPGQLAPITVTAPLGKISVNALPWADVEIDGKAAGQTPLANLSVTIGQHDIVFRHPQLGELHQTAVVKATTPTRLSVTFPK
jgi:hypothetical protein